ncbi:AAA family ATPase [Sorangium sp. So ce291]|uniref:trifunctional serine/threonine-protein kinase/ATP-binding protein/sensor histidine kinase n=1 Tax=Sorangium sp. So ce291 TaxID=3133294 RepID=UPI003F637A67
MVRVSGYMILETLHESSTSMVYRALRGSDGLPVVVKMLADAYPTPERIAWFQREYEVTRGLSDVQGCIGVHRLHSDRHRWIMEVEDLGGTSLAQLLRQRRLTAEMIVELAPTIVDILGHIHRRHIIHKDVNPANIVLNPGTGQLKIIDFGLSSVLSRESPALRAPSTIEGTLAYISPEQTGRMNRSLDYRTDFYSLGVTLYELLTGQLPFSTSDVLELVHSHIARRPTPPHELDGRVDPALSVIVMKLLEKNAEDRYQSAYALLQDLEEHRRRRAEGSVEPFELGRHDVSDRFQIPQKLYGREQDKEALLDTFERVAAGAAEVTLIGGYAGIGKSALIKEIHRPITRRRGYFISGKFEQLQRDVPYASLIQAFRELIRQLLAERAEQIADCRRKLLEALGHNGRVITDVIPELEAILGPQPPLPEIEPSEAQNRFYLAFQRFTNVFARPEHPLVLFLDDLQWADGASLELCQALLTGEGTGHLLLVGAYRDNEVNGAHPLLLRVAQIRAAGVAVREMSLQPLALEHVNELVSDALRREPEATRPLAELALRKTGGNPFFLGEFLKHLHAEQLICFDFERGTWAYSVEAIEACGVTDNVVVLMAGKVQKLRPRSRQALMVAACVGNVFDLRTLSIASGVAPAEVGADLWEAVVEGLIEPLDEKYKLTQVDVEGLLESVHVSYRFAHDRVQQAAYTLLSGEERRRAHWKIGKVLLERTPSEELGQRIFDIANHLEHGLESVHTAAERDELARLYLQAGGKAKASAAYAPALHYLLTAIQLASRPGPFESGWIPSAEEAREGWEHQYQLCLELFNSAAEAACLAGEYDVMQRLTAVIQDRAASLLDKVRSYKIEIQSHAARDQLLEGVEAGRRALAQLGVDIPEAPDVGAIGHMAAEAAGAWAGREIEDLLAAPEMTDPERLAAMEILARLYIPAFNGAPAVFMLVVFHELALSIRYGVTTSSARGLAAYGLILCAQGDIESGYRFGTLAMRLADRFGGVDKASTIMMFNLFVRHWRDDIRDTLPPFLEGYQLALAAGDLEYAALNLVGAVCQSFWAGRELPAIAEEAAGYARTLRHLKQDLPGESVALQWQAVLNLMGESEDPRILTGLAANEPAKLRFYLDTSNVTELAFLHLNKLMLCYLFGDHVEAVACGGVVEQNAAGITPLMGLAVYHFYDALAWLGRYSELGDEQRARALERVDAHVGRLRAWAEHAPVNFEHKVCLVEAERAWVLGDTSAARELYDRAISLAHQRRFLGEEALAHERAAYFHRERGYYHLARNYLVDAHYVYERWGARAKLRQLEAAFPQDLGRAARRGATGVHAVAAADVVTTSSEGIEAAGPLDLLSVLKASQVLSGEIVLERLLARLLRTAIENAGAQRASLVLERDGQLVIEATVDSDEVQVLQSTPVASSDALLPAVIYLVARSGKPEVLNDAAREGMFVDDPYVQRSGARSILCMPLVNQGKLTAILYLENRLVAGAFTYERVEVLHLLSAEMAIAIDNARLYRELEAANRELARYSHALEDKVAERTRELAEKNQELQRTLDRLQTTQQQLILREKMASLGMLTAGIAHELRNPFNFINNFSKLLSELAGELQGELEAWIQSQDRGRLHYIRELLGDVVTHASTIERHGKRANAIVGSMLLYSFSSDERAAADLNELVSQALQLAYHGSRSRDAAFSMEIVESYDETIGSAMIVPQEISRVIINLIENACYSTGLKAGKAGDAYSPKLWVTTARKDSLIEIRVRDNGVGIAQEHLDKIFNPFFTTKPTGEGTGLGLSISYDIVVRKHRGVLRVDTREGEFAEFIVELSDAAPAT